MSGFDLDLGSHDFFFSNLRWRTSGPISKAVTAQRRIGRTIDAISVSKERRDKVLNQDSNGSAKIYQFPAGGRAGLSVRYNRTAGTNLATAIRVNETVCYDSWYHQAAIDESKPARDH